jgi:hypothetical protein
MPDVTIQSGSLCAGGNHRTITTDQGVFKFTEEEITESRNETATELRGAFLDIVRHRYKERRAAGRTHAQAMADFVGFVVRL